MSPTKGAIKLKSKPKAKKLGRPPIDNPASLRINFRVTGEARDRYHAAANAAGLGLTAWMKTLMDRAAPARKGKA